MDRVSILVLVDVALKVTSYRMILDILRVSILVLVDVALKVAGYKDDTLDPEFQSLFWWMSL